GARPAPATTRSEQAEQVRVLAEAAIAADPRLVTRLYSMIRRSGRSGLPEDFIKWSAQAGIGISLRYDYSKPTNQNTIHGVKGTFKGGISPKTQPGDMTKPPVA